MKKVFYFLMALTILTSCKEQESLVSKQIEMQDQNFKINENPAKGSIVGTFTTGQPAEAPKLELSIIGGNIGNAFAIDKSTGVITVKDSSFVDYEKNKVFELIISALDQKNLSSVASVFIEVINVKEVPTKGIVARYTMQGNSKDVSGNGYHLSNNNGTLSPDRDGAENSAYYFNGSSGLILASQTLNNQSNPQTIALWFKTEFLNTVEFGGVLFAVIGPPVAGQSSRYSILFRNGYVEGYYGDEYDNVYGWVQYTPSAKTYNDNKWHHAVFSSYGDDKIAALFIDGELINAMNLTKSNNNVSNGISLKIGGDKVQNYFKGYVDDVILYNRSLSVEEILALYKEG